MRKFSVVVSAINPRLHDRPLLDFELKRFDSFQQRLVDLMDSSHGLVERLFACRCIDGRQKQEIEGERTSANRNKLLIDMFTRKSKLDLERLIHCLATTGQRHVARMLERDGCMYIIRVD